MQLLPEEKETLISKQNGEEDWDIYTTEKPMMTKLEKIGLEAYKEDLDQDTGEVVAKYYKLPLSRLTFAKERKKTVLSEERRKQLQEHIKQVHAERQSKKIDEN